MTREEMLGKLKKLDFVYLWPGKISENLIGFTEHPIWLNKEGYGYFACDESSEIMAAESISNEKWLVIRDKQGHNNI